MAQLIVAMMENGGIGFEGKLPWYIKEELQLFQTKTMGKTLLIGSRTESLLPPLPGRKIICLTKQTTPFDTKQPVRFINNIDDIKNIPSWQTEIFVAGGAQTYHLALKNNLVRTVHMSIIKGSYKCDTFFDRQLLKGFVVTNVTNYEQFNHYVLKKVEHGEQQYLDLLEHILSKGVERNGRNGKTVSTFVNNFTFDLREGFPLLTTKKMFLRGILEEFIFFLNGKTDSSELEEKNVNIWKGNTSEEFLTSRGLPYAPGVMGPMYGRQWRNYNAPYYLDSSHRPLPSTGGIDQLDNVIKLIKNDPCSRRILMTAYNPCQAEEGVLFPCHSIIIQFYVEDNFLDMFCYNRSQDVICGIPFNIASSALLLITVAKLTQKTPRMFNMTMGDTHIYEKHIDVAKEQMIRLPYKFPNLEIPEIESLADIKNLRVEDFHLLNYKFHPRLKVEMVA